MMTMDIEALYTSIPIEDGITKVGLYLRKCSFSECMIKESTRLPSIVLNNNYLEFNDIIYKQKIGCAIRTPTAPLFAVLYVAVIEDSVNDKDSVIRLMTKTNDKDSY
ncbi:hypothetical protein GJ496_010673 [Pomphorhynchus laevis]|nr:hypothetical protein GJ496_010673 [Pomphorhynchus laevis]